MGWVFETFSDIACFTGVWLNKKALPEQGL
jgi:hypothetical protein